AAQYEHVQPAAAEGAPPGVEPPGPEERRRAETVGELVPGLRERPDLTVDLDGHPGADYRPDGPPEPGGSYSPSASLSLRVGLPDRADRLRPHRLDHVQEDLLESQRRAPADRVRDLLDRRDTVVHILDSLTVDLVVGNEDQRRARARRVEHSLGQVEDPDLLA